MSTKNLASLSFVIFAVITFSSCISAKRTAYYSNTKVCGLGIKTTAGGKFIWDMSYPEQVQEAQSRGFTLKKCARILGRNYKDEFQIAREEESKRKKFAQQKSLEDDRRRKAVAKAERDAEKRQARLAQEQRTRKLEAERQRKAEAERIRIAKLEQAKRQKIEAERHRKANAERIRIAKIEHAKKSEDELRKRLAAEHKRQVEAAHEREMAPIRRKNRNSLAVIIGNRNYSGRTYNVDYAHRDADAMKRFIINKLGYREGNIFDLRDAGVNAISAVLGNEKSHEGDLFNALRKDQSDVIIYYSGHGVPGLKDERPYLLPVDGDPNSAEITGFSVDTMYANLAKLPARSVTVFLDACFSGESEKGMLVSSASGISVKLKMPSSKSTMTIITAAQGNQLASWDPKAKHGLFTKHLLDALNGEADSKEYGNYDGKVSLSEIQNYLDEEMTYQARATWKRRQNAYVRGSGDTILSTVFRVP
jgi:hypothetical protein